MSLADDLNRDKKGPNKRKGTPYLDTFGEDLTKMASEGKTIQEISEMTGMSREEIEPIIKFHGK